MAHRASGGQAGPHLVVEFRRRFGVLRNAKARYRVPFQAGFDVMDSIDPPERIGCTASTWCGPDRCWLPVSATRPCCRATATISRPSATVSESDLATHTSDPTGQAMIACMACQWSGVAMIAPYIG